MSKSAVNNYDQEVWFFLRAVWEAVPKISFTQLCKIVEDMLKKPVPTPSCVGKRCRGQKWTKSIRSYCRKADRSLESISCRLFDELKKEYEKIQKDKSDFEQVTNGQLPAVSGGLNYAFEALENVANIKRKTISVLLEHRRRTGKIGQLLDDSMDWMYEAKEAVFDESKKPEELDKARRQFGLLEQMVEKIESFARTAKYLQQTDFLLFGINIDDTRDSDSENRVSQIHDDSKFNQARNDLEEQFAQMQQQVHWIQSGGFEEEVMKEMEAKMRQEEAEDAEEIDYQESDDED